VRDGEDGGGDGGLPGGESQSADAAVERRQALLEHVVGGVHQPRVNVAEFLQSEQVRGAIGVLEHVTRSGIDGDRPGRRGRVGLLAGMQSKRAETWFAFLSWHDVSFV
jgi:hypothetical protein